MNYNALSLFSSAGVAETYFEKHGIHVKVAAELLPERASFYRHLYPKTKMMQGDITDDTFFRSVLSAAKKDKCDFLIATPPCQGMSTAGKQKKDDPRNRLIIYVVQAIKILNPKFVIIENVPEILLTKIEIDGKWIKIDEYLKNTLGENYTFNTNREQIRTISVTYKPLRLFAYTNGNIKTVHQWVDDAVLGRVSDNSLVFRYDENSDKEFCFDYSKSGSLVPGVFEQAILKAFNAEKKNVYIVLDGITEAILAQKLSGLCSLLKYKDNFLEEDHGWSIDSIENKRLYDYLTMYSVNARNILENQMVRLPSNIHIVGAIIMNENDRDIQFDYEFQRCLVNTEDDSNVVNSGAKVINEKNRLTTGCNVLLYGVPGSGKSWTVKHEYCKPGSIVERLVFHPDYTYSDFIGQILPAVAEDGQVSYKFTPGPFTNILREAYNNPGKEYILSIEEINRGNAPAIFGEVFQLLDRKVEIRDIDDDGYPIGTSEYGITNMNIAEEMYGKDRKTEKVRIPSNLSIIGTMNTSDQNVFTSIRNGWCFSYARKYPGYFYAILKEVSANG